MQHLLKNRKRTFNHWLKQKRKCYYCGTSTVLVDFHHGKLDNFHATLEHIYSRLDIRRNAKGGGKTVMACYGCNQSMNNRNNHLSDNEFIEQEGLVIDIYRGKYDNAKII